MSEENKDSADEEDENKDQQEEEDDNEDQQEEDATVKLVPQEETLETNAIPKPLNDAQKGVPIMPQPPKVEITKPKDAKATKKEAAPKDAAGIKNDFFDEAHDVSGSDNSVESEKDDPSKPNQPVAQKATANAKVQDLGTNTAKPQQIVIQGYDPSEYANLNVSPEITELFQYIARFKPQNIDLETKIKPFIPEFIPAVGEVDAFLKIPRPDGAVEALGLTQLDEPTLMPSDPSVLEIQYTQYYKKKSTVQATVRSIENAEKNPKEVEQWVTNINDLHKTSPPISVQYTKQMPDIETLMQEWPTEMEEILEKVPFPGPDLKIELKDYVRIICMLLDIPIHNVANNKSLVEALHVVFTLYIEFKQNPHFQKLAKQTAEKQHTDDMKLTN